MSKKFLVIINNLAFGGAERLAVDQINELTRRGNFVELLLLVPTNQPSFAERLTISADHIYSLPLNFRQLKNFPSLIRFLARRRDFVIITHLFLANTLVRLAALFLWPRPRLIVYEHNVYTREKNWRHRLIDRCLSLITDRIIAVSAEVRDFWLAASLRPSRVRLVENGIAVTDTQALPEPAITKQAFGLSPTDLLIVSVGNVTPQKGYELILAVAEKLVSKYPTLHFLICGRAEGDYATLLKEQALKRGLTDRVHFVGARSDALAIIKAADIFLMPSWWEGLSISLLEALSLGRPVITTDIPSMKPIIKEPGVGLVFSPGDQVAAGNLIDDLLAQPAKRALYGNRALEASRQYSIVSNIDRLLVAIS